MTSAVSFVFDNKELRKLILTHVVREKYNEEVFNGVQRLIEDSLLKKWYHYCRCEMCKNNREYHLATYGELL